MKIATKDIVSAALALDPISLHYRVEMEPDEALDFVANVEGYNEATSERLGGLIIAINEMIPRKQYPGDNPNNGQTHHKFWVGREHSRVLYLEVVKAYLGRLKMSYWAGMQARLQALAKAAKADEFSIDEDEGSMTVRFWWD